MFDRRDVVQHVAEWSGDRLAGDDIERLADRWLASDQVIVLAGAATLNSGDVIRNRVGRGVSLAPDETRHTRPTWLPPNTPSCTLTAGDRA